MEVMALYGHPNSKSFAHAILAEVQAVCREKGHALTVRDLYALGFDPVLKPSDFEAIGAGRVAVDVKTEQDFIRSADLVVVIYPLWWAGLPAILKGYIDRVLTHGFAYSIGPDGIKGLLAGKKAVVFTNQGAPQEYYDQLGMTEALKQTMDNGIFRFCGFELVSHTFFGAVPTVEPSVRAAYLVDVRKKLVEALA